MYANIVKGQNKITAKISCSNNPSLIAHNSLNVTGASAVPTLVKANVLCLNGMNNNNNSSNNVQSKPASCIPDLNINRNHPLPIISVHT